MTEVKKVPVKKVKEKEEDSNSLMNIFTKGILKENGIFVMALGLCPALAVTRTLEGAIGMGILVILVLTMTNSSISLIRKLVPNTIRIPIYVMIIATQVTIIKMLVDAFAAELAKELGVFIALITVNCIVLGRAEAFASKNNVLRSAIDGVGVGLGFGLGLVAIGFFREFFGTGTITLGTILPLGFNIKLFESLGLSQYAFSVLVQPPGAFLVIGLILAGITAYRQSKGAKK
jgi:Na+-translocating ferredoxin:NAD+ oxidoreductase subunit E